MMPFLYNLSKFVHIVSAMIWVGGVFALLVINGRMAATHNRVAMQALTSQAEFYGQRVLGPAAGLTLLAGITTAGLMRVPFSSLWIIWGFAGIFGSMLIGAIFVRRATAQVPPVAAGNQPMAEAVGTGPQSTPIPQTGAAPAALVAIQRRLTTLNIINLLLLLSTVMAMVFKPTL